MGNEENEEKGGMMQFFDEIDSKMSNIPFEMKSEDIESFISKCMQPPENDYFGEARMNCPDMFQKEEL